MSCARQWNLTERNTWCSTKHFSKKPSLRRSHSAKKNAERSWHLHQKLLQMVMMMKAMLRVRKMMAMSQATARMIDEHSMMLVLKCSNDNTFIQQFIKKNFCNSVLNGFCLLNFCKRFCEMFIVWMFLCLQFWSEQFAISMGNNHKTCCELHAAKTAFENCRVCENADCAVKCSPVVANVNGKTC